MSRYLISALALMAALAPSASFAGDGDASTSVRIMGYVPVICRATLQGAPMAAEDGSVDLGNIDEFCNAPGGYRIVVDYAGAGDLGALVVDGQKVPLDPSGRTVLVRAEGPAMHVRTLSYVPGTDSISSIHVSVETDFV